MNENNEYIGGANNAQRAQPSVNDSAGTGMGPIYPPFERWSTAKSPGGINMTCHPGAGHALTLIKKKESHDGYHMHDYNVGFGCVDYAAVVEYKMCE